MTLFKNQVHQDIWIGHHCERCARMPAPCPIIQRVLTADKPRKPVEWQRNNRKGALMAETYKCDLECRKLPTRPHAYEDMTLAMFDVDPLVTMDDNHA